MKNNMLVLLEESVVAGKRLGRHLEWDARNAAHLIEDEVIAGVRVAERTAKPVSVMWPRYSQILNQGDLGSCTGNAMTGWLGCTPSVHSEADAGPFNENFAVQLYESATTLDSIPGQYPPDDTGSSGMAVAKAAKKMGLISAYKHATTTYGLLHALQSAPVIVGVPWVSGFDNPDSDGLVEYSGYTRGGHEFLIRGYDATNDLLWADNSWGTSYGKGGSFCFTTDTWNILASRGGDCVAPRK